MTSAAHPCIPAAPCGADAASTTRRIASGRIRANSCATKLPIEKPRRSTYSRLSASTKSIAPRAMLAIGWRRGSGCRAHADVIEGNDAPVGSQGADERRIPVVEVASEVDQQNAWD